MSESRQPLGKRDDEKASARTIGEANYFPQQLSLGSFNRRPAQREVGRSKGIAGAIDRSCPAAMLLARLSMSGRKTVGESAPVAPMRLLDDEGTR